MIGKMLSTKQVAQFLGVNEKMVYTLVSEKGLPATKITGKWLFPQSLVEQWIESHTINYPQSASLSGTQEDILILAGSNDPLLEKTISLFNSLSSDTIAVFGNIGSMGGINALKRNCCHIAASHLLEEDDSEYNFDAAQQQLDKMPVMVNFCRREQGILLCKGNPHGIQKVADLGKSGLSIVNRRLGTGTRLLFDHELIKAGLVGDKIDGYQKQVSRHIDVGLEILTGKADAGPGIRPIAEILGLDFLPLRWERYDLLVHKDHFFCKPVQNFLGLLHEKEFRTMANSIKGYDIGTSGKMVFPQTSMA